jgi:hypothetical protein
MMAPRRARPLPCPGAARARKTPVAQLAAPSPIRAQPPRPAARPAHADLRGPNEPKKGAAPRLDYLVPDLPVRGPNEPERLMAYLLPEPAVAGPTLHEAAARWLPNEPDGCLRQPADARPRRDPRAQEPRGAA